MWVPHAKVRKRITKYPKEPRKMQQIKIKAEFN